MFIPTSLRLQVIERAANCCEYCGFAQAGQKAALAPGMNRPLALAIREEEAQRGRHPPRGSSARGPS